MKSSWTFLFMLLMVVIIVGIVILAFTFGTADFFNWFFSAFIGGAIALLGVLFLGQLMQIFGIMTGSYTTQVDKMLRIFLWIVGIAAAIYLAIIIRPYIAFC